MSVTQPNAIFETGRNNLKPLLVAVVIFVVCVVMSVAVTGLP